MPRRIFPAGTVTNTTGAPLRLTFYTTSTTNRRETDLWTIDSSNNLVERIPNGVILTDANGVYSAFAGPDDINTLYVNPHNGSTRAASAATGYVSSGGPSFVTGIITPEQYGAQGDGRMVIDVAMTSGSATLTSATGLFTRNDIGKTIVVVGAGAAGAVLKTTIAGYTSASSITLTATASTTVTGQDAQWGTDDTTAIQAAFDAASTAHTMVQLSAKRYLFTHLNISDSCTIAGTHVNGLFGLWANSLGNFTPLVAPFLTGSVLVCITNGQTEAINIPNEATHVNLRDLGLMWASPFVSTGHGIKCAPGANKNGLTNARWTNVYVWGHDGNSYAWYLQNATKGIFQSVRWYGGGGLYMEQNQGSQYGNFNFIDMEGKILAAGTAHGSQLNSVSGDWTRLCFVGCEFNAVDGRAYAPLTRYAFTTPTGSQLIFKADTATTLRGLSMISPAFDKVGVSCGAPTFPAQYNQGGIFIDPGGWFAGYTSSGVTPPMIATASTAFSTNALVPMDVNHTASSSANVTVTATSVTTLRLCDATSAGFTVTLPAASAAIGRKFTIKKIDSTANVVTVATGGGNIDGASTYTGLSAQWKYVTVQSDGTKWYVMANN